MTTDREDEDFTAYTALTALGLGLMAIALVVGMAWLAFDRWGKPYLVPDSLGHKWTLRAGVDP